MIKIHSIATTTMLIIAFSTYNWILKILLMDQRVLKVYRNGRYEVNFRRNYFYVRAWSGGLVAFGPDRAGQFFLKITLGPAGHLICFRAPPMVAHLDPRPGAIINLCRAPYKVFTIYKHFAQNLA